MALSESGVLGRVVETRRLRPRRAEPSSRSAPNRTLSCLVASGQAAHRELLAATARQWGWHPVVHRTSIEAFRSVAQFPLPLAFVDVTGADGHGFCNVASELAGRRGLLVLCGHPGDEQEDIWARQLGAWFYLPGLRDGGALGLLCRDAKQITERMTG